MSGQCVNCKELAIIHEESRSGYKYTVVMDISVLYNYYFDENFIKIEAVVIYGICSYTWSPRGHLELSLHDLDGYL